MSRPETRGGRNGSTGILAECYRALNRRCRISAVKFRRDRRSVVDDLIAKDDVGKRRTYRIASLIKRSDGQPSCAALTRHPRDDKFLRLSTSASRRACKWRRIVGIDVVGRCLIDRRVKERPA